MLENWQNWCRLCAKQDFGSEEAVQEMEVIGGRMNIVKDYFLISPFPFEDIQCICSDCSAFLAKVDSFRDQCVRVDQLFSELSHSSNISDVEVQAIRSKYGFETEEVTFRTLFSQELEESDTETVDTKVYPTQVVYQEIVVINRDQLDEAAKEIVPIVVKEEEETEKPQQASPQKAKKIKLEKPERLSEDETEEERSTPKKIAKKRKKKEVVKVGKRSREKFCKLCSKVFISYSGLTNHMVTKHPKEDQEIFLCPECPKEFASRRSWRKHQVTHLSLEEKMIFHCEICDKKFSAKSTLKTHVDSYHLRKTLFVCDVCGKSCNTKGALMQHRLVHSNEYPYECSYCGKKFKFLPDKKRHEEIHTDTKYECSHCGLMLNTRRNLRLHKAVHSDVRKYKCNYCGHEFKRPAALKHHLLQHTGQRPYKCLFCDKSFTNNVNCKGHQKKKHPDELEAFIASGQQPTVTKLPKIEELQTMLETPEYLEETIEIHHIDHLY